MCRTDCDLIELLSQLLQSCHSRNEGNSCKGEPCYAPSDLSSFLVPFWTLCQTHLRSWSHFDKIRGCKVAQMHFKTGSAILSYQSDSLFSSSQPTLWLCPKTFISSKDHRMLGPAALERWWCIWEEGAFRFFPDNSCNSFLTASFLNFPRNPANSIATTSPA